MPHSEDSILLLPLSVELFFCVQLGALSLAAVFRAVNAARGELGVTEYSVSEATLEQVSIWLCIVCDLPVWLTCLLLSCVRVVPVQIFVQFAKQQDEETAEVAGLNPDSPAAAAGAGHSSPFAVGAALASHAAPAAASVAAPAALSTSAGPAMRLSIGDASRAAALSSTPSHADSARSLSAVQPELRA